MLNQSKERVAAVKSQVAQDRIGFRKLMALRKKYSLSTFQKDEILGSTASSSKRQMQSLDFENLFVITMDYLDGGKGAEAQRKRIAVDPTSKFQLMRKVVVKMASNSLQLNFHPLLSKLAKTETLKVRADIELGFERSGD